MARYVTLVLLGVIAVATAIDITDDYFNDPSFLEKKEPCEDKIESDVCQKFKDLCNNNKSINDYCRRTCGFCSVPSSCIDRFTNCPKFLYHCGTSKWMSQGCRKSCKMC